jgi:hypothetical protein
LIATLMVAGLSVSVGEVSPRFREAYAMFSAGVAPGRLRSTVNTLSGFGSRVAGYPGDAKAADYVQGQFNAIGLESVRTDAFPVTVPYDPGVDDPAKGAYVDLNPAAARPNPSALAPGHLPIYPLWPNLVRTSTLPINGLTAPVIYVRDGRLRNFNHKDVEGSIVMVDFNCSAEWLNAPRLGAKAVIFVAPDTTMRGEAEAKFISIPISIPRFYMKQADAAPLMAACDSGRPPMVTLHCNMPWATNDARNITGWIKGTDPGMRDQVIVVQAFYDSISVVPSQAPGAENACGIAAMLEIARAFKAHPPKRSMMFVATSAHFQALGGIRAYVDKHMEEWIPAGWFQRKHPVKDIYLWAGLDLSSQSTSFGIFYKGWFYDYREDIQGKFSDIARVCRENSEKVGATLGFEAKRYFNDGVNPVEGKGWRSYISGKPAFDSEVVTMAGGEGITFATTDDSRALVDTPFDTPDRVNIANLARQVRLLECLFWHIVTDSNAPGDINAQRMPITEPSKWSRMALQGGFATVQGRVQMFDPRKAVVAWSDPRLSDTLVVIRNRTKSFMGVRGNMITRTAWSSPDNTVHLNKNGEVVNAAGKAVPAENFFSFNGVAPLTAFGYNKPTLLAAYHLNTSNYRHDPADPAGKAEVKDAAGNPIPDPTRGEIDFAPDLGTAGAKTIPLDLMVTTATKETPIIVFRCVPTAIYDLVDQQSLRALTGMDIYDGATNGEPRMYGYAIDPQDPTMVGSYVEDVAVLFSQPGARLKISMGSGPGAIRLLLINSTKDNPEGIGYLVAGDPRDAQNADIAGQGPQVAFDPTREIARSGAIYDTALRVAEDMHNLDHARMEQLAKYRIVGVKLREGLPATDGIVTKEGTYEKEGIAGLHGMAEQSIELAHKDKDKKDWEKFDADSRAAWGFESRAYPDVQQTAMDVVQGVLFYLALLLPFAFFCERLLFGFYDLKRQISVAGLIFLAIFIIFSQVHPAFDITHSTLIVLLAFVMLALSSLVIAMITGKFEEQLKQMNRSVSGVHRADIGRVSVAMAAFSLGVSNMRRRKARTVLTCITLVLLTFTVLSFTSVVQTLRFNEVHAPSDHGPRYNGIMIRTAMWDQLQEPAYRLLADEFGASHKVAPRAWFFGTELGEQSFLTLTRAEERYDAKALVGLSPAEAAITRPQEALQQDDKGRPVGRWFEPGDVYAIELPDAIASALHIEAKDVGHAKVNFSGVEYTVIGILDSQKLKDLADLDNEIITPVDFITMNKLNRQGKGGSEQGFKEYTHLEPDMVFFIPYQTALNLGAELRSIAIDFGHPKDVVENLGPLMHRLGLNLYAGQISKTPNAPNPRDRGDVERYSSLASTSSRGMEMIFFPILIAALIVLNTMLTSVFERIKEIHIFSSIGLAPSHIGMLFVAEAMVYAILGSVSGYLLGQLTSKVLVWFHWLPDLYLNFSSVSAVMTTMIVVAVVLLSTLYPARKASEVATPAIDRTWRVPDPDGDHWIVPLPFAVTGEQASGLNSFLGEWFKAYEEYSIGDFVTQNVESDEFEHEFGTGYQIRCMTWLAPFDLGVSQRVAIETTPTSTADVYDLRVLIDRESGDISNWKRVNRRFLNTLRKQFLIWRTLKQSDRERYLMQADMTAPVVSEPPAAPA